jgi:histone-binding protein RBBP4
MRVSVFMHGGFTEPVNDFSWNLNDPWVMAAAAGDNQMQIFRPARNAIEQAVKQVANRELEE